MIPTHLLQTGNDIDRSVYEQILQFIRLRVTERPTLFRRKLSVSMT